MARGITTPNRVDVSVGVASGSNAVAYYNILATLLSAGWTVRRSSDGTTYNASGNQISSGSSGAGGLGNANAWFVIRSPDSARYFCIQIITLPTATSTARVKYAKADFTGGSPSATVTPSAAGEVIIRGGGTDAAPTGQRIWSDQTAGTSRVIGVADGAAPYGFWFMHVRTDSVTDKAEAHFVLDPLYVPSDIDHSTDTDQYVIHCSGTTNTGLTQSYKAGGSFVLGTTEPGVGRDHTGAWTYCPLMSYATQVGTATLIGGTSGIKDAWTNLAGLMPCFYHCTVSGYKGNSTLFWTNGDPDATTIGKSLELFTTKDAAGTTIETREFIRAARYAFPWGGAVPASGTWTTANANVIQHIAASAPAGGDATAPVINGFVPAVASTIDYDDTIQFDVTDNIDELSRVIVSVLFTSGNEELIYDGSSLKSNYSGGSTVTVIANGLRFVLARSGNGWLSNLTLRVVAYDLDGNEATPTTYAFTVNAQTRTPVVSAFTPVTTSTIDYDDTVAFSVTDELAALSKVVVMAQYSDSYEVVHDGTTFSPNFATGSTRTGIANGFSYSLLRDAPGWPDDMSIVVYAVDSEGNSTQTTGVFTVNVFPPNTPPTIENVTPEGDLNNATPITFDVLDDYGVDSMFIWVKFDTDPRTFLIYDGSGFKGGYAVGSSVTGPNTAMAVTIVPDARWTGSITELRVRVIDANGVFDLED